MAAASARTELPSGPRRRWRRGQALLGATRCPISHCGPLPGRPDAGNAARKKPAVTNRDKKDSIRARMADMGESFNVARRKVEAASASHAPAAEDSLIEVEVGTDAKFPDRPLNPRHIETFWGRWIVAPDPERLYPLPPGSLRSACFGVAQTRQGRIAVYMRVAYEAKDYPSAAARPPPRTPPSGSPWRRTALSGKGGFSTSTRWPRPVSCRKTSTSRRLPRSSFTAISEPRIFPRCRSWTGGRRTWSCGRGQPGRGM